MSESLNYKKCRFCGYRPQKEPSKFCTSCGREYKEIYNKEDEIR